MGVADIHLHRPLQPGDLVTVQQAVSLLPVGRTMLYELVAEGQISSLRVKSVGSRRGRILIFRSSLEDYVRRHETTLRRPSPSISVDELRDRIRRTRSRTKTDL